MYTQKQPEVYCLCRDTIYDVWLIGYIAEKPMGAGISDKTAGSIISVLPVLVSRGKNL